MFSLLNAWFDVNIIKARLTCICYGYPLEAPSGASNEYPKHIFVDNERK